MAYAVPGRFLGSEEAAFRGAVLCARRESSSASHPLALSMRTPAHTTHASVLVWP